MNFDASPPTMMVACRDEAAARLHLPVVTASLTV